MRLSLPVLALAAISPSVPAAAQTYAPAYSPPSDADALAGQMRVLADDPRNLYALIAAGNLSLKLGDGQAAAALFQRAELVAPTEPRVKAGMAATLVQSERPGEALRLYAQAVALGANERDFGSDRGLAYDLIGDQGRAQRDYRAVLARGPDDETTRRYALSLGISGQKDRALALLEPLNRKSDRGAWRARAFVLAMNGDRAGAERIATGMMPPGMADGLRAFFARLPALSASDRAFAVHFGEVRGNPARTADLALAPRLAPLPVEVAPPVMVATAAPVRAQSDRQERRLSRRERRERERAAAREPVRVASRATAEPPLPAPPAPTASQVAEATASAYTPAYRPYTPAAAPTRPPTFVETTPAMRAERAAAQRDAPSLDPNEPVPATAATPTRPVAPLPTAPAPAPAAVQVAAAPVQALTPPAPAPAPTATPTPAPTPAPTETPVRIAAATVSPTPIGPAFDGRVATPAAEAQAVERTVAPSPTPAAVVEAAPAASPGAPPAPSGPKGDAILAAIVANIAIPAAELTPTPPPARAPVAAAPKAESKIPTKPDPKALAKTDPKLAKDDPKKVDPKKADSKKADAKKPEPKKPDPKALAAKAEPARIWVQVAGGANEDTLPKAWAATVAKAPAAFKGRSGWTTPLRATNRILTGPFKTAAEAQAFVNTLTKAGLSGFVFTSEAGQKIARLAAK